MKTDRIIVALDYPDAASALALVESLGDSISFYKVGLQLFTAAGADVISELRSLNKRVFLDLKFHDIPNTVAGAVRSVAKLGVNMLTVHASGGAAMMEAAVAAAEATEGHPLVLAVTVLTSMDASAEQVLALVRAARDAGCGGIVCSANEIAAARGAIGSAMQIVVPGIRPTGAAAGDQARIATPAEAIARGADYLVIGRPITAAADPQAATRAIIAELSGVRG